MVGSQPTERVMEWRRDLQQLEELVEHALRTEGHTVNRLLGREAQAGGTGKEAGNSQINTDACGEPECEAPSEGKPAAFELGSVSEVKIDILKQSIMRNVITPLLEAPWEKQEEQAGLVRQLPLVVEGLTALLRKTWLLAGNTAQQQQQLIQELTASRGETRELEDRLARAEADRMAAEAEAGQGEKAHDLLEGTVVKLTTARKTIKDMEWELVVVRRRCEELTRERTNQDRAIRDLQTALERHAISASEAERRCLEVTSQVDAQAAQQRGELRRQISVAELERDQARAEALEAQQRREDMLEAAQQRTSELEAQLAESRLNVDELGKQVKMHRERPAEQRDQPPANGGFKDERASETSVHRRRRESTGTPSRRPPTATSADQLAAAASQMASRVAAAAALSFMDTGLANPAAAAAGARPPPKTRRPTESGSGVSSGRAPSTDSTDADGNPRALARPPSHGSLPMDMRSLGQLLSGGAVKNRK